MIEIDLFRNLNILSKSLLFAFLLFYKTMVQTERTNIFGLI